MYIITPFRWIVCFVIRGKPTVEARQTSAMLSVGTRGVGSAVLLPAGGEPENDSVALLSRSHCKAASCCFSAD